MDDRIVRILRAQAWERAKGELLAVLHTYQGEPEKFIPMDDAVNKLIYETEQNGWVE